MEALLENDLLFAVMEEDKVYLNFLFKKKNMIS